MYIFQDRKEAGVALAKVIKKFHFPKPYILALPRGGVVVAYEVARILHAPLDVIVSRKLGAPSDAELGIGAISENKTYLLDDELVSKLGIKRRQIEEIRQREEIELSRRLELYRKNKTLPKLEGFTAILVDDGLATGITARVSIKVAQKRSPHKIIFAVPVASPDSAKIIENLVDKLICLENSIEFRSVGQYYRNFSQINDKEVMDLLTK